MANVELDFQILDPSAEGLQMNVLLVAAKRELVDSRTSLLGEAGLQAAIIDVDAFAIHNAFELNHPDAMQGVVAIANIGHEITNVNILEDGVPVLTRDLSVGTRRFREDLQREKGLSAEDSEKVIQGQAQHPDLASYVDARGEEIAVGVERAAAFLATASRSAGGLSRVYTAGGGSRVPGLNDALSSRLKVPVEAANPIQRLVAPVALLNATLLAEVSDATPPKTPEAVTAIASAIKPSPMRRISGRDHSASLIFSQRIRLPKDLSAPQIDTIAHASYNDHRKENCHIPSNCSTAIQDVASTSWNWTELITPSRKQSR